MTPQTKGLVSAFVGFSFFAFADTCMKFMGQNFNPIEIGLWTQATCLIVLFSIAFFFKKSLRSKNVRLQMIRGALAPITYGCVIYSYQHMSLALTYSIFFTAPFFTALFSVPLLREKIGANRLASIIVGFIGVLIVLRPGYEPFTTATLAALVCALTYALSSVISRKIGKDEPILAFSLYPTATIFVIYGLYLLFTGTHMPDAGQSLILASAGVLEVFGALLVAQAFVLIHAVTAMKFSYFNLVWAVLLGYLIFGDTLDLYTAIGSFVIIGSGLYLAHYESKSGQQAKPAQDLS